MISIIIPAYNLGKYISDCLDSIRQQTYTDYEVIVVNDGSKDNTLDMLNEYKRHYPEFPFTIIDKPNGGVTAARRDGFLASKGEWIFFMDGDDLLPADSLQILYDEIRPDINAVCGSFDKFIDGTSDYKYNPLKIKEGVYPCSDAVQFILKSKFDVGPWAKLYRRSLIKTDVFNLSREITFFEDTIFNLRIFSQAHGLMALTCKSVYHYRTQRVGSAVYSRHFEEKFDLGFELLAYQLQRDAVNTMQGFMIEHRDCIAIKNYNHLWNWRKYVRKVTAEQYVALKKMYDEIRLSDIVDEGIKKYIKIIIIWFSLLKFRICL